MVDEDLGGIHTAPVVELSLHGLCFSLAAHFIQGAP